MITGGGESAGPGHFIQPTVIADVPPTARIAQEEIFGPVLAVIRAENFDAALAIANNTDYGLTGAVYTRDRHKLEKAIGRILRGEPLFEPKVHGGAWWAPTPSGALTCPERIPKPGGHDYLLLFTQAKTIAERMG